MSRFMHFTVAVEYTLEGRTTSATLGKIAEEIEASLVRHADTVAAQRAFDANTTKAKVRVLPVSEQPMVREARGWHVHDNDGCCTPCGSSEGLYGSIHREKL